MWPSPTFYKILLAAQILPCFFCKKKRAKEKEKEKKPLTPWALVIWAAQPSSPPPPVASLLSVHPTQRPRSPVATEPCRRPRRRGDKGDIPSTPRALPSTHPLSLSAPAPFPPQLHLVPHRNRAPPSPWLRHSRGHRAPFSSPTCPRAPPRRARPPRPRARAPGTLHRPRAIFFLVGSPPSFAVGSDCTTPSPRPL